MSYTVCTGGGLTGVVVVVTGVVVVVSGVVVSGVVVVVSGVVAAVDVLGGGGGGCVWPGFAIRTAAITPAAAIPAAAGTQRGKTGITVRVPDKREGVSGLGGSATIEKALG